MPKDSPKPKLMLAVFILAELFSSGLAAETLTEKLKNTLKSADEQAGNAIDNYKSNTTPDEFLNYSLCLKNKTDSEASLKISTSARMQSGKFSYQQEVDLLRDASERFKAPPYTERKLPAGEYSMFIRQAAKLNFLVVESKRISIRQDNIITINSNSTIVIDNNSVEIVPDRGCRSKN